MAHEVIFGLWRTVNPYAATPAVTVINTVATGYYLEELKLETPTTNPVDGRVVETAVIRVRGSSLADLRTKLAAIYDLADQVRRKRMGENALFGRISIQALDSGNTFWSELYAVHVAVDQSLLGPDMAIFDTLVTITYERDGWWESPSYVDITLTNPNGTATSLNIANCNDGTGVSPAVLANYVDIDTTDIDGDLPAPALIALTNAENVAAGNQRIYIGGIGVDSGSYMPTLFYEAEVASGGTIVADATCSGGNKKTLLLTTDSELNLLLWTIGTSIILFLGMWYKVIARFASASSLGNVKFRWKIYSGSVVVWSGPQFVCANTTDLIQELGSLPLPPTESWSNQITLVLTGQRTTSATETLYLDYIQFMTAQDSTKLVGIAPQEYSQELFAPRYDKLRPFSVRRESYFDWYAEWNTAIYLNPRQYYRLHFVIQSETAATAEKDRKSTIRVRYRPRYRSIGE